MDGDGADHFEAFVDALAEVVGHADAMRSKERASSSPTATSPA
jgi:hypothetical protein